MIHELHDQIDMQEDLRIRAREIIEALKPRMADAVEQTGDTTKAMELIALAAEEQLRALTTEAVQDFAAQAEQRARNAEP